MTESSLDARLLGLEPSGDRLRFVLQPHLCRPDGMLYGGTALAAALAAMEVVTGRPALWASTQLVSTAAMDDVVEVDVEPLARGHYVDQVRVTALVGGEVLFAAVGSTATGRRDGLHGLGVTMPAVTSPEDSPARVGTNRWGNEPGGPGHHQILEMRTADLLDGEAAGRKAMWVRMVDEPTTTAAKLGFLADMVPLAICDAAGVMGAGTSLDNSLRVGHLVDCDWILLDLRGQLAHEGYGYGEAHCWSPDGTLLGTGTQTAKLFSFEQRFGTETPWSD